MVYEDDIIMKSVFGKKAEPDTTINTGSSVMKSVDDGELVHDSPPQTGRTYNKNIIRMNSSTKNNNSESK